MAQFTIYRNTDTEAPTLRGVVGDLVNLLDKCLVTGYGDKSAAGWTKPFTGTNKAAFRNAGGCPMYLRVQDDGPGGGTAKEARITGYETMSDVDTGTGPFPTSVQGISSTAMLVARKSATADTTTRNWIVVADSRTVYVFISTGDTAGVYYAFMFGEIYAFKSTSDDYRNLIVGRTTENSALAAQDRLDALQNTLNSTVTGHFMARSYTGTGTSIAIGKHGDIVKGSSTVLIGRLQFPNGPDGGLYLSPVYIYEPTSSLTRGKMRGLYHFCHALGSVNDGDVFDGIGEYNGKSFLVVKQGPNSTIFLIETSDTLDTN